MAIVILKKSVNGVFQTVGTKEVKNLGWLFRHANDVTELHFKKLQTKDYLLKAIMMNGNVFETTFASRSVFADVFNRNKTLRGIVVFFDDNEYQTVGELTTLAHTEYVDMNGNQIHIGSRVEIPAYTDWWMRGDRFGVVTKLNNSIGPWITVCLDKTNRRYRFVAADCRLV